jgi:hypothetical protein
VRVEGGTVIHWILCGSIRGSGSLEGMLGGLYLPEMMGRNDGLVSILYNCLYSRLSLPVSRYGEWG